MHHSRRKFIKGSVGVLAAAATSKGGLEASRVVVPRGYQWLPEESNLIVPETGFQQPCGHLTLSPDGDILLATTMRTPSPERQRRQVMLRSGNGGKTWSKPVAVTDQHDLDFSGTASMVAMRSGRIIVVSDSGSKQWPGGPPRLVRIIHSDDGGKTWQRGDPIDYSPWFTAVPMQIFEEPEGSLVLTVWGGLTKSDQEGFWCSCGILRSHDGGMTWVEASVVGRGDGEKGHCHNEIAVRRLDNGPWLAMWRLNFVAPSRFGELLTLRSVSYDQGQTWTRPQPVLGPIGFVSLTALPDGGAMVGGSGPYGVRYVVGYDAGASWHYEDVPECGGDGSFWAVTPDEDTVFAVTGSPTGPATQDRPGYYQRGLRGFWIRKQPVG